MNQQRGRIYIAELTREIGHLRESQFEVFGYRILDQLHPIAWNHRGTNTGGSPVLGAVDSSSVAGDCVAEYSSESGYFSDVGMPKLHADIANALKKHPQATRLWMFSSREAGPTKTTEIANIVNQHRENGRTLRVIDARSAAEFVVNNLEVESFIDRLVAYLPFLGRARDEWALSHQIPTYPSYQGRSEEAAVESQLRARRLAVVTGISGSGKSAVCSALARKLSDEFDLAIWVDAADLVKLEELRAFDALRNGTRHNILGLLRARRTLLVLDNTSVALPESALLAECGPESMILITTQHDTPEAIKLLDVQKSTAQAILCTGVTEVCPPSTFEAIWQLVGGHPLILSILNSIAQADSWGSVLELCSCPERLEDPDRKLVCDRILAAHERSVRFEFRFIRWCDSPRLEPMLFAAMCDAGSRSKLARRHFLAAGMPGIVHVHDLVFRSIQSVVQRPAGSDAVELANRLAEHIERCIREDRSVLERQVRMIRPLLRELLEGGDDRAAFRYAYALPRASDTDLGLLGDVVELARRHKHFSPKVEIEARALIETIEATYSIVQRQQAAPGRAKEAICAQMPAFQVLLAMSGMPPELQRDLRHHQAKALVRGGEKVRAESEFRSLVGAEPNFSAARLQLSRLLDGDRRLEQIEAILRFAKDYPGEVPDTVYMGAVESLRARSVDEVRVVILIEQYKTDIVERLKRASAYLDQPYRTIAALGSRLSYNAPQLLAELMLALPTRLTAPEQDNDVLAASFEWAEVQKQAAKALQPGDPRRLLHLRDAKAAYEEVQELSAYQSRCYAECLLLVGEPAAALAQLDKIDGQHVDCFVLQRRAQAFLALKRHEQALRDIDAALAVVKEGFESTFLRDRWLIRRASGDRNAIEDLRAAQQKCTSSKFHSQLSDELREAEIAQARDAF